MEEGDVNLVTSASLLSMDALPMWAMSIPGPIVIFKHLGQKAVKCVLRSEPTKPIMSINQFPLYVTMRRPSLGNDGHQNLRLMAFRQCREYPYLSINLGISCYGWKICLHYACVQSKQILLDSL